MKKIKEKFLFLLILLSLVIGGVIVFKFIKGQFTNHNDWVNSLDVSKSNKILSTSKGCIFIWKNKSCIGKFNICNNSISNACFSFDEKNIAVSCGNFVRIVSSENGTLLKSIVFENSSIRNLKFDSSGKYLVTFDTKSKINIIDWKNNKLLKTFPTNSNFSLENDKIIFNYKNNLYIYDIRKSENVLIIKNHNGIPVFSKSNEYIALKNYDKSAFTIIDFRSKEILQKFNIFNHNNKKEIDYFVFSPDGKYLAMSIWGGDIEIWNWQKKKMANLLRGHILSSVNGIEFNNSNNLVSVSGDHSIKIWDWKTNRILEILGNGEYLHKYLSLLLGSFYLGIFSAFIIILFNDRSLIAKYYLLILLSFLTLGLAFLLYYFREKIIGNGILIIIILLIPISFFLFITIWFGYLAYFSTIISLSLCFVGLLENKFAKKIILPLIINLLYLGLICFYFINKDF